MAYLARISLRSGALLGALLYISLIKTALVMKENIDVLSMKLNDQVEALRAMVDRRRRQNVKSKFIKIRLLIQTTQTRTYNE